MLIDGYGWLAVEAAPPCPESAVCPAMGRPCSVFLDACSHGMGESDWSEPVQFFLGAFNCPGFTCVVETWGEEYEPAYECWPQV